MTLTPSLAKALAMARPMPLVEPVMTAERDVRLIWGSWLVGIWLDLDYNATHKKRDG
jgi:hypothetical protein